MRFYILKNVWKHKIKFFNIKKKNIKFYLIKKKLDFKDLMEDKKLWCAILKLTIGGEIEKDKKFTYSMVSGRRIYEACTTWQCDWTCSLNFNREKKRFTNKGPVIRSFWYVKWKKKRIEIINRGNNIDRSFIEQSNPVDLVLLKRRVHIIWEMM